MYHQIGQQFIIGLEGPKLSTVEADFIVKNNIGGVILMGRNCESPAQVRELCASLQALRHKLPDKAPLFIAIDMEGGRVARLKAPFTQWPSLGLLGKLDSTAAAFKFASFMGAELKAVGINLDFAPSVDVLTNSQNEAVGDRAAGADPELVSRIGSALVRGYIKSDIIPCAKHFPGHGNTSVDSHFELPIENKTYEELDKVELVPFKKAFRARLDMVMAGHILYPKIDPDFPATLSKKILTDILRKEMRFRNLVITDDLDMKALTNKFSVSEIPVHALNAGANILLYCNNPESHRIALEAVVKAASDKSIDKALLNESYKRITDLKKEKLTNPEPMSLEELSSIVGHPDHLRLSKSITAGEVPEDLLTT